MEKDRQERLGAIEEKSYSVPIGLSILTVPLAIVISKMIQSLVGPPGADLLLHSTISMIGCVLLILVLTSKHRDKKACYQKAALSLFAWIIIYLILFNSIKFLLSMK
ncbi:hypothetical protein KA183_02395 [bacterium]|nr:hypothetical protein [bacterium]